MNEIAAPDDDAAPAFDGLRAMFVNCTLKKSPERSHSQGLADISRALFEKHGVAVDERYGPSITTSPPASIQT